MSPASERLARVQESQGLTSGLAIFRQRWLIVVAIVIACIGLALFRHHRAPKEYKATANVAFRNATLPDSALQVNPTSSGDPVRDAATEATIAHSQQVAAAVQRQLNTQTPASALLGDVKVEPADNADILNISATTGDPTFAAKLANAFANQYILFKSSTELEHITAAEDSLKAQINALPVASPARSALQQSLQRLGELRSVAGGGASIIGQASPPRDPAGSGITTTVVLGLLLGLALASSLVFLLESLDRRVKSVEEFEREYRLPTIATIPQSAFKSPRADERGEELEPYRILRSSLDLAAVTRTLDTLLITSATEGEGKTTVAVDLAHAAALDGRRVVLVELDLRRPTFARHFNLDFRSGLTLALAGGFEASDLLVEPFIDLPNFSVLPAGPLPPNPAELLASTTVAGMLSELAPKDGILIVDSPPLNPVADTHELLISGVINAPLIVARLNKTTRDSVRQARSILARHVIEPVGLVVTGVRGGPGYGYERHEAPGEFVNGDRGARQGSSTRRVSL
jgi:capsular exopolysaccharide synthesis family protein